MHSLLIVDDEPLARQGLEIQLQSFQQVDHVTCCADTDSAIQTLASNAFHAMFLDIDLPGRSGFGLLDELSSQGITVPPVIFTTGHLEFALKAFDYPVLDYLVKPVNGDQLKRAMAKLSRLHTPANPVIEKPKGPQTLQLKNGASWLQVAIEQVLWIEAAGDYMCVHTVKENHILRTTLRVLEEQLREHRFVRINRSSLVNLDNVVYCKPTKNGSYQLKLSNEQQLRVSRKYKMMMDQKSCSSLRELSRP